MMLLSECKRRLLTNDTECMRQFADERVAARLRRCLQLQVAAHRQRMRHLPVEDRTMIDGVMLQELNVLYLSARALTERLIAKGNQHKV